MGEMQITEFRGIDQSVDAQSIKACYAPDAQNVHCEGGQLSRMKGATRIDAQSAPKGTHSLAVFHARAGERLLAIGDEGVYALGAGGGWERIWQGTGLARTSYLNYAKDGEDILLLAAGGPLLCWAGEGAMQVVAGAPTGLAHLALHYERVWAAGGEKEPDTVYWSRPYDPSNWSNAPEMPQAGGGFVLVPTWNGGRVRAVKAFFNDVVVFKDEDIFRIYGTYPGNYEVVKVHGIVGPLAERTIAAWGDKVFFFSKEGLCAYNGVSAGPIAPGRVARFLQKVNFTTAARTACAVIHKEVLYLALPEGDAQENTAILQVDLRRDVWMIRRGVCARDMLVWKDRLLLCDDTGRVMALGEGESYDGAPIVAHWFSPEMDFGAPGARKWGGVMHLSGTGEVDIAQRTERGESTRTVAFGPATRYRACRLRAVGRRMQLCVKNARGGDFCLKGGIAWEVEGE